ncbi:tyrosine-type recombinase/integrase [Sandarakinorhabdus sp.]|uniref:tyrosine-type recombinase/integrase n=1 Tax=Sandarakinorhabdus sp. TaxID=1916663 RepID=UPI003567488D
MARPRLAQPRYRLAERAGRFYVRWWSAGWHRVSARTTDRREAERFLAQFVAGTLEPAPPAQPTISAILDGYLADKLGRVAAHPTLRYACAALRRHLGDLAPDHLTVARSRLYARQRRAEGHQVGPADARRRKPTADGTIAREIVTLRAALKWAAGQRWIASIPTVEAPRATPPRARWLSREEAGRLIAACLMPHVRLFVALGLYTAARSGAVLALTWPQVDLHAGLIYLGAGTGNKRRAVVPIADALRPYLTEARAGATCAAVIEHAGRPVASIKTGFMAAAARAELPGVTPHILRHTACTWMVIAGVPPGEVARFAGMTEKMVETVYGKHSPDYLRRAAAALSGSLAPKTKTAEAAK